jgi:hypothetical protein
VDFLLLIVSWKIQWRKRFIIIYWGFLTFCRNHCKWRAAHLYLCLAFQWRIQKFQKGVHPRNWKKKSAILGLKSWVLLT